MRNRYFGSDREELFAVGVGVGSIVFAATIGTCIGIAIHNDKIKTKEGTMQPIEAAQETELIDVINGDVQVGDTKTFEPGEHYICVRMPQNVDGYNVDIIEGAAINNIPEGYEVYQISPYIEKTGTGSGTGGYDIWFVNTETVKVTATESEGNEKPGYYTFGTVVEDNKELYK